MVKRPRPRPRSPTTTRSHSTTAPRPGNANKPQCKTSPRRMRASKPVVAPKPTIIQRMKNSMTGSSTPAPPGSQAAASTPMSPPPAQDGGSARAVEDRDPAGAIAQCKDGIYSHAKGRTGACSRHGGVGKWLWASRKSDFGQHCAARAYSRSPRTEQFTGRRRVGFPFDGHGRRVSTGELNMSDNEPGPEVDVTKDWRATQGQNSSASVFAFSPRSPGSSPSAARSPGSSCSAAQVRSREPAVADRHPGRDRDLRHCRQPDVESGQ